MNNSKNILRIVLAIIIGLIVGSLINGLLIQFGPMIIPPPEGVDLTTEKGLIEGMIRIQVQHFIFPFLAHALGSLTACFVAYKINKKHSWIPLLVIATLFFSAGMYMVFLLPSPLWFTILDLGFAYFPMAFLGKRFALGK